MNRIYFLCAAVTALTVNSSVAFAHELSAHVHGVATLEISVDTNIMTLDLSSPLDNLLGFEHPPRNANQQAAIKGMVDNLNKADRIFIPTADAQCTLQSVRLDSPVLDRKEKSRSESGERAHADLDGEFIFACRQTNKLHDLEVKLFDTYPNLHQIKVEIATKKKQAAADLTPDQRRASW